MSYANSGDTAVGDPERVVGYGSVAFGRGEAARELSRQGLRIDLAFDAALDTWTGEEKVQLNVKEIRQAGPELPCVPACPEHAEA